MRSKENRTMKNKTERIQKLKQLQGISDDERAYLIDLVNTKKKYGLVWEEPIAKDVESTLSIDNQLNLFE